jgi:hypothetical protein
MRFAHWFRSRGLLARLAIISFDCTFWDFDLIDQLGVSDGANDLDNGGRRST